MVRSRSLDGSVLCVAGLLAAAPAARAGPPADVEARPSPPRRVIEAAPPAMPVHPTYSGPLDVSVATRVLRDACETRVSDLPAWPPRRQPEEASGLDRPSEDQMCAYVLNPNTTRMSYWLQGGVLGAAAGGIGAITFVVLRIIVLAVFKAIFGVFRRRRDDVPRSTAQAR